jgi:hypothetical protein
VAAGGLRALLVRAELSSTLRMRSSCSASTSNGDLIGVLVPGLRDVDVDAALDDHRVALDGDDRPRREWLYRRLMLSPVGQYLPARRPRIRRRQRSRASKRKRGARVVRPLALCSVSSGATVACGRRTRRSARFVRAQRGTRVGPAVPSGTERVSPIGLADERHGGLYRRF